MAAEIACGGAAREPAPTPRREREPAPRRAVE